MTKEEYAALATTFKPHGLNCAQSVIKALEDFIGPDTDVMIRSAAGFGGGMGCMEATCGALIGAGMIASHKLGGRDAIMKSREILKEFEAQCGATICKDLKAVVDGKVRCECPVCIMNATRIAIEKLGLETE